MEKANIKVRELLSLDSSEEQVFRLRLSAELSPTGPPESCHTTDRWLTDTFRSLSVRLFWLIIGKNIEIIF